VIKQVGDTTYNRIFLRKEGPEQSLAQVAEGIPGPYRHELERNCSGFEYHIAAVITDKNFFNNAVAVNFAEKDVDEAMVLHFTKEPAYKYDGITSVLAIKKRVKKLDEGAKAGTAEVERVIREGIKKIVAGEKNTKDQIQNKRIANKITMEIQKSTKGLLPELKWSYFISVMTAETHYEIGYSDAEGSDTLRIEVREINEEFHVLAITIGTPNA